MCEQLAGHDLVLVTGAPVFSYYPYVPGKYLPDGCQLLHITDDPEETGRSPVATAWFPTQSSRCKGLLHLVERYQIGSYKRSSALAPVPDTSSPMSEDALYATIGQSSS